MASARKRPTKPASDASAVVLEDMRSQFKVFGEALGGFRDQVACELREVRVEVRGGLEEVRREMRDGFERVDLRFVRVDQRLERLEADTRVIKLAVIEQGAELKKKVNREEVEALVERARLSR